MVAAAALFTTCGKSTSFVGRGGRDASDFLRSGARVERIHVVFAIAKKEAASAFRPTDGLHLTSQFWRASHLSSQIKGCTTLKKKLPTTKNVQIFLLLWAFFHENGRFLHFSPPLNIVGNMQI